MADALTIGLDCVQLLNLPNEILLGIAEFTDRKGLKVLRLTNKQLYRPATKALSTTLTIRDKDVSRPKASRIVALYADKVRYLNIQPFYVSEHNNTSALSRTVDLINQCSRRKMISIFDSPWRQWNVQDLCQQIDPKPDRLEIGGTLLHISWAGPFMTQLRITMVERKAKAKSEDANDETHQALCSMIEAVPYLDLRVFQSQCRVSSLDIRCAQVNVMHLTEFIQDNRALRRLDLTDVELCHSSWTFECAGDWTPITQLFRYIISSSKTAPSDRQIALTRVSESHWTGDVSVSKEEIKQNIALYSAHRDWYRWSTRLVTHLTLSSPYHLDISDCLDTGVQGDYSLCGKIESFFPPDDIEPQSYEYFVKEIFATRNYSNMGPVVAVPPKTNGSYTNPMYVYKKRAFSDNLLESDESLDRQEQE